MAVYTHVTDTQVNALLAQYDCGHLAGLKGIAEGVENSNYLLETTHARYILTLYERRVAPEDLPFFLDLMTHLADKGLPSARPVPDRQGQTLQTLSDRPTALIEFVPGLALSEPGPPACFTMGAMLARVHGAVDDFAATRDNPLALPGLIDLAAACGAGTERCSPGLGALIESEISHQRDEEDPGGLRRAVVHTDFFPDNVLFSPQAEITGLIDWYFACTDSLVYDLAVCLNAWCFDDDGQFCSQRFTRLLDGYLSAGTLSEADRNALPLMLRRAALRFLLTRTYDWLNQVPGAVVRVKDPLEYRDKLRFFQKEAAGLVQEWLSV